MNQFALCVHLAFTPSKNCLNFSFAAVIKTQWMDIISDMLAYCGQLYLTGPLLTPAPPASKIVWLEIQAYYAK